MINDLILYYVLLGVLSLAIGSLLNVIIHRLPIMLNAEWTRQCQEHLHLDTSPSVKINLFLPRSFCPSCKHQIAAIYNIPLLSYLFLRGQCAYCRAGIPLRYPLVEVLCAILSLLAAYTFGFNLQLLFALLFIWLLICMFFIDLKHQLLPDSLCLGFLWVGLIANTQYLFTPLPNAVLSAVGAYASLWLLIKLFYWATGKIGMGHGDFKLFAAFGAWFGWTMLPFILLFSSLLGAVMGGMYLFVTKKTRETPIPFGPFLCVGGLIALFYGQTIMDWYWH